MEIVAAVVSGVNTRWVCQVPTECCRGGVIVGTSFLHFEIGWSRDQSCVGTVEMAGCWLGAENHMFCNANLTSSTQMLSLF